MSPEPNAPVSKVKKLEPGVSPLEKDTLVIPTDTPVVRLYKSAEDMFEQAQKAVNQLRESTGDTEESFLGKILRKR